VQPWGATKNLVTAALWCLSLWEAVETNLFSVAMGVNNLLHLSWKVFHLSMPFARPHRPYWLALTRLSQSWFAKVQPELQAECFLM